MTVITVGALPSSTVTITPAPSSLLVTAPLVPGDITEDTVIVFSEDFSHATVNASSTTFALISQAIGPKGDPGPQGPPTPITALTFVHQQATPMATWSITHTLPYPPSVTVVDSALRVVEGDVQYLSATEIEITFSAPFAGAAYLS